MVRHNDVRDEAGALAAHATSPSQVSYEPSIFYGADLTAGQQARGERGARSAGDNARGDLAVHGLFKRGEQCVLDVRVTDCDAPSNRGY